MVLASLVLLLAACDKPLPAWNAGKLIVIVPEVTAGAEAEFERELARMFAEQLQTTLVTIALPQYDVIHALGNRQAHLAAASLRIESEADALVFGPVYQNVRELVVCNLAKRPPKSLADLPGRRLAAVGNSPREAALREAQKKSPFLHWQTFTKFTTKDLLADVAGGALDCATANELQFSDARNYHPNLIAAFDIASPSDIAWGFPKDADPQLLEQVHIFFSRIEQDGTLRRLLDRFYGHYNRLETSDSAAFITRTNTILPRYRRMFEEAATLTGEDWRLLAALAYQESQWDPLATSYTNVRGMMMLTGDTADRMKVSNRLDARESIIAGSKYLVLLKNQLPDRIPEPDRTWLALAAYNQGFGHLEDARILTKRSGQNPDSWADVKRWMPLLNQPGYYETLKHGYARGGEAVILVENIRNYYAMLKRLEPEHEPTISEEISYHLIEPVKKLMH